MIKKKSSTISTLFTILNWEVHQIKRKTNDKPKEIKRQTKNKPYENQNSDVATTYDNIEKTKSEPKENKKQTSEVKTATNNYIQENNTTTVLYIQHPDLKIVLDAWELKSGVMPESVGVYDQKKIHQYIITYGLKVVLKYFTEFATVKAGWLLNQIDKDISNDREKNLQRSGIKNNTKQTKVENKSTDSGSAKYWEGK